MSARNQLGINELFAPGLCVECDEGHFHANEDHFLVEVQDGELLLTTLCREAMPLLRFCTRVSCALHRNKCPCGRTGAVIRPGPLEELFPDLSREDWRKEGFAFGEVKKETLYAMPNATKTLPVVGAPPALHAGGLFRFLVRPPSLAGHQPAGAHGAFYLATASGVACHGRGRHQASTTDVRRLPFHTAPPRSRNQQPAYPTAILPCTAG